LRAPSLPAEGTKSRSTLQLEADLLKTGSTLSGEGLLESSIVTLSTATRRLEEALDLYADVILNPSFPDKELHRLKLGRLALLKSRSLDSRNIAQDLFSRSLYHPQHPYARPYLGTPESVRSITRQDVIAYYRRNFVPGDAALVVVGNVWPDAIVTALETRFGKWPPGPIPPAPDLRPIPSRSDTQMIYLIDKPGAQQSVVSVGRISSAVTGRARYGLEILLKVLSGRLATNLCDEKGCSYEIDSYLLRRNGEAPWVVRSSVHKLDTTAALAQIFEALTDLTGPNPITKDDIRTFDENMVPTWFYRFECIVDVASEVADLVSHGLPDRQWATELNRYAAVTENETSRVARRYLTPLGMKVLIVGDRGWIEALLRTSPFVKSIILLDSRGNRLPNPPS